MNYKELFEEALQHLVDHHCAMVDAREIKEQAYCQISDDITCEQCWRWYLEEGSWWDRETEPDPDRKWKEMREG